MRLVGRAADVYNKLEPLYKDYRKLRVKLPDGGYAITHMDGKVLGYFERHPGATQSDLAQHSGRDKAQLARLIKGLRDQGLLRAEADEADRRNLKLFLTADGQAIQQALQLQAGQIGAKAISGLTGAEQRQLLGLLQRVKDNLGAR